MNKMHKNERNKIGSGAMNGGEILHANQSCLCNTWAGSSVDRVIRLVENCTFKTTFRAIAAKLSTIRPCSVPERGCLALAVWPSLHERRRSNSTNRAAMSAYPWHPIYSSTCRVPLPTRPRSTFNKTSSSCGTSQSCRDGRVLLINRHRVIH